MEPESSKGHLSPPTSAKLLKAVPLTWDHCTELAQRLPKAEKMECTANGYTAQQALAAGLLFGLSWAVLREDPLAPPWGKPLTCIGAFGYTSEGAIWSLWGKLTPRESLAVLRFSRQWIPHLVELSGRPTLCNVVHSENEKAIDWLEATGCVNFDYANPRAMADGSPGWAFETYPAAKRGPSSNV